MELGEKFIEAVKREAYEEAGMEIDKLIQKKHWNKNFLIKLIYLIILSNLINGLLLIGLKIMSLLPCHINIPCHFCLKLIIRFLNAVRLEHQHIKPISVSLGFELGLMRCR